MAYLQRLEEERQQCLSDISQLRSLYCVLHKIADNGRVEHIWKNEEARKLSGLIQERLRYVLHRISKERYLHEKQ